MSYRQRAPRLKSNDKSKMGHGRTKKIKGMPFLLICLLSVNLIFFAFIVPFSGETPMRKYFEFGSIKQYANATASLDSAQDAIALIRNYKIMPPLMGLRTPQGTFDLARRVKDGPILYYVFHVFPAVVWSITMPIQHIKQIRTKMPKVHRLSGYMTFCCSFLLGVTGLLLPRKGLTFTHPNYLHFHVLRVGGTPVFAWPNFALQSDFLGPAVPFTAYKAWKYAYERDFTKHEYWAQLHTYVSYTVPMQRIWVYVMMVIGFMLPNLPASVLERLHYPVTDSGINRAELAGFASTVLLAYLTMSLMLYHRNRPTTRIKQH